MYLCKADVQADSGMIILIQCIYDVIKIKHNQITTKPKEAKKKTKLELDPIKGMIICFLF